MTAKGIKLVEHSKLLRQIFPPKPTLFQVTREQSIDGIEGVYTIPVQQYFKNKDVCYKWWRNVFAIAGKHKIKVEVLLVTKNYCSGFLFHEPESSYVPNYKTNPNDEFYRLRSEALAKDIGIQQIQKNLMILKHVIAGTIPLTSEFQNHLIRIVGDEYSCMDTLCFGENPSVPFPVGDYLFYSARKKGLHPWDLADAGIFSIDSADFYSKIEAEIESAERDDLGPVA